MSLLDDLRSDDYERKRAAIDRIAADPEIASGDDLCFQELLAIVRDPHLGMPTRDSAARAVGGLSHGRDTSPLLELIVQSDAELRSLAASGLSEWKTQESVHALIGALSDDVNNVRNVAERSLLKLGEQTRAHAVERLIDLLRHEAPLTRSPAARLLGAIGDQRALAPLIDMLQSDETWLGRMWAARGLGDLGSAEALAPLAARLKGDDKNRVRAACAEAIAQLRLPESASLLRTALQDSDAGVKKAAEEGLNALGQADASAPADPFE